MIPNRAGTGDASCQPRRALRAHRQRDTVEDDLRCQLLLQSYCSIEALDGRASCAPEWRARPGRDPCCCWYLHSTTRNAVPARLRGLHGVGCPTPTSTSVVPLSQGPSKQSARSRYGALSRVSTESACSPTSLAILHRAVPFLSRRQQCRATALSISWLGCYCPAHMAAGQGLQGLDRSPRPPQPRWASLGRKPACWRRAGSFPSPRRCISTPLSEPWPGETRADLTSKLRRGPES